MRTIRGKLLRLAGVLTAAGIALSGVRIVVDLAILDLLVVGTLLALGPLGFWIAITDLAGRLRRRTRQPQPARVPGGAYLAFTGLGVFMAALLTVPGFALALMVYLPFALSGLETIARILGAAILFGWLAFCVLCFAMTRIEMTREGVRFIWTRLRRVSFVSWEHVKVRQLWGPVFFAGSRWALPVSWFIVRQHDKFLQDLARHLGSAGAADP